MTDQVGKIKLFFGDSLKLLQDVSILPDNSIDAVISDPPYGLTKDGKSWNPDAYQRKGQTAEGAVLKGINAIHTKESILGNAKNNFKFEKWMKKLAKALWRVVKPGGFVALFGSSRSIHRVFSGFEDVGFQIRSQLLWIYATSVISKGRHIYRDAKTPEEKVLFMDMHSDLLICHEPIMLAQKPCSEDTYAMNIRKWGVGALNIGESRFTRQKYNRDVKEGYFTNSVMVCPSIAEQEFCEQNELEYAYFSKRFLKNWSDVYLIPKPQKYEKMSGDIHPSVKPLNLMEHIIRLCTKETQTVLDMFLGSGTTLVAAQNLGRAGVGFEIEERYRSAIMDRLKNPAIVKNREEPNQSRMFESEKIEVEGVPSAELPEPEKIKEEVEF